jgi:hypothetical protein
MRRAMKVQADAESAASAQYRNGDMQFHVEIARERKRRLRGGRGGAMGLSIEAAFRQV